MVRRPRDAAPALAAIAALIGVLFSGTGVAQTWRIEPSIGLDLTFSDNAGLVDRGLEESDLIVTLSGDLAFRRAASRFKIDGVVGFDAIQYVEGTARDRVLPRANIDATFEAIDDFFFLNLGAIVTQTQDDVFGVRPDGKSTVNKVTTSQYKFNPYLQGRLTQNLDYRVGSENLWTDSSQSSFEIDDSYIARHSARIQREPEPIGGFVSIESNTTEYEDQTQPALRNDIARIVLQARVSAQLEVGLRGGYERASGVVRETENPIYGGQLTWRPSERTDFTSFYEDRYFGDSWQLRFTHRMPRLAWNIASLRDVSTYGDSLRLPGTANLSALLDSLLTTRIPDAAARSRAVQDLLTRGGLPSALLAPVNVYTERVVVVNRTEGTVSLNGVRNVLAFTVYRSESRDLATQVDATIPPDLTSATNNRQRGAAVTYSLRVGPLSTFSVTGDWTHTRGLDAGTLDDTRQQTIRALFSRQLGPRTTASAGVRHLNLDATLTPDTRENAAFVTLGHRF